MAAVRMPCDEAVMQCCEGGDPCREGAGTWILAATILGSSMAFIDSTVVNVALPAIQNSFHASVVGVQWVVEAYGLFLGALILAGGSLGDVLGRRRIFVWGVVIFVASSIGCGIAQTLSQLIIARSVQGLGAALLVPGSLSIISASFAEKERGHAIGLWSGFTAITMAIGPVLGGWLVEHASWRWAFFLNVPLGAAVVLISYLRVPESRASGTRNIDWLGATLATLGLGGLVYGFIESVTLGWGHPLVWGSLIGGCCLLGALYFAETRAQAPMVPLQLFESRTFAGANFLTLFLYSALGVFFFILPLNLIQVQGYSPTAAGAAMLPVIFLMFSLSRWSGGLVARYGARLPLTAGPVIAAAGFAIFSFLSMAGSYWTTFFPALLVLGFGMAVTVAPLTTVVMSSVDQERAGAASGINNAVARVAGVLAVAVLGILMVAAFGSRLNQSLDSMSLPADVRQQIRSDEVKLAGMPVPAGLDPPTTKATKEAIGWAFIFGFRIVMVLCAGLSLASAAVTWRMTVQTGTQVLAPAQR